jgi:CheY-like chemotaxis protein
MDPGDGIRRNPQKPPENGPDFGDSHRHAEVAPFARLARMRKLWRRTRNTILVIHEDQSTRDGIVQTLDTEGFMGIPAERGEDAMRYLQSGGQARVILLDERADWTAFRRAQQHDPRIADIPVMAISPLQGRSAMEAPRGRVDVATLLTTVRHLCSSSTAAAIRAGPRS